jgi:transcriptional antiterminator RfaH
MIKAPLFPRYVFISIDLATQRWRSVLSTFGVSRLVCNGELPSQVPDEVIAELKGRENEIGLVQFNLAPRFKVGDRVRVTTGPFVDCLGLYEGMRDCERVAILLELLGRKVRATLDSDYLTAA